MKKVLFATTALVASAGIAAAQGVEISGSAEMGIVGGDGIDTQFFQSVDVRFSMSGETDNGLTFGATVDADDIADMGIGAGQDPVDSTGFSDFTVFLSGAFGTLTMGDTDGAYDRRLQEVNLAGGSIADDETSHAGFWSRGAVDGAYDGQVLRYDYDFDAFGFSISLEQDSNGAGSDDVIQAGLSYDADLNGIALGLGLGYATDGNVDIVGVSIDADFGNGFQAAIGYDDFDGSFSHFGLGVAYTMDALTVAANYGEFDNGGPSGYGLVVNYDLGGGAEVQFGYGGGDSPDTFSLGVAMGF